MISIENILFGIGGLILGIYILRDTSKAKPSQNDLFIIKTRGYTAGGVMILYGIYVLVTEICKVGNVPD